MCDWVWGTRCRCSKCVRVFKRRVFRIGADEEGYGGVVREDGPRRQANGLRCPECGGRLEVTMETERIVDTGLMLTWKEEET